MILYSSLLSFQTPPSLPCLCSTLLIVCSSPIVCTCSSSPSVFSLCVPASPVYRTFDWISLDFRCCPTLIGILCCYWTATPCTEPYSKSYSLSSLSPSRAFESTHLSTLQWIQPTPIPCALPCRHKADDFIRRRNNLTRFTSR